MCLVAGFMTLLDVSIVNVALPDDQDRDPRGRQRPAVDRVRLCARAGAAAGALRTAGDARGRRTVFMTGVALFALASAACGAAPSATFLVLARVVQGFAGGLITPQVSGFIQTLFQGEERGKAFGYFGTTIGVSTAIGPLLGGLLIALFGSHSGWRAVFFVNLPVAVIALMLARRYLPPPNPRPADAATDRARPDRRGAAGSDRDLHPGPFIEQRTWHSPLRPSLFVVAAVLAVFWVLHERRYGRTREPVVSLDLFKIRSYVLGAGVGLLFFAGFTGHVLHPQPVSADRPALLGAAIGPDLDAVRRRRRAHRVAGQPPRAPPGPKAGRLRAGRGDRRPGAGVGRGARRARAQRRLLHSPAAADRRDGRRIRDLAEPDAVAVRGAQPAGGQRRRRAPDRPADRLGGGNRDHRERVLFGPGGHPRRLRAGLPPRAGRDRRVLHRGADAGACRRVDHAEPIAAPGRSLARRRPARD